MEGRRLIRSLKLKNLLSYGSEGVQIELEPLNILVGPNGSGKSNLLEAIRLLQSMPNDFTQPFMQAGGISEWLWKGAKTVSPAEIETTVAIQHLNLEIFHLFQFMSRSTGAGAEIRNEEVSIRSLQESGTFNSVYAFTEGHAHINVQADGIVDGFDASSKPFVWREISLDKFKTDQSILSQRNDPEAYPALSLLKEVYDNVYLYTDTSFGRLAAARSPQNADAFPFFLYGDASNLALVLNTFQMQPEVLKEVIDNLKLFYSRVEDISTLVQFGTVQMYFREKGLQRLVPATRLSDGTLRFLCLLAILCHPSPPSLICIEEPELGLHPDILPTLAKLLIKASQRTQLIVTTHSDILLSEFTDMPEAVIVCDRDDNGTSLKHLNKEELQFWLRDYSLGEAWLKNAFGGTRW